MRGVSYKLVTAQEPRSFPVSPRLAAVIFVIGSMAIGSTAGRAAGLLELLFGNPHPVQQAAPVAASASAQDVEIAQKGYHQKRVWHKAKLRRSVHATRRQLAKRTIAISQTATSQTARPRAICVRVSDGYFFPTGNFGNFAALQSACDVQCPNMETRLFLYEKGSDKIEDAKDARNGAVYSAISSSFIVPPLDKQAHGSHPLMQTASAVSGIFTDPTLRRGDLVVTQKGIRMFKGRNHFPYQEADFTALRKAEGIPKERLAMLTAMERSMATAR